LSHDYGSTIAIQLRAQGFAMGLGGGANLTRDPRGGPSIRIPRRRPTPCGGTAGTTHQRHSEPEGDGFNQTLCGE
jgi:hypothetical protein